MTLRLHHDELIIDSFAGGGGASLGIEWATGRSPDVAINHDPEAIAMHAANHPTTHHLVGNVWDADPRLVCRGRKVGLAWFSPDCTFHSRARGGKPFRDPKSAKGRRGLAWVVVRWARAVKPRVIMLENVSEFLDWGPLDEHGRPDEKRAGLTFRVWIGKLKAAGYEVETREIRACDYGAPTSRKRLFIIARSDGLPIVWPAPTHGPGRTRPFRTAAECIDWTIDAPSIFERSKPLAEKTLARIVRGIRKYALECGSPFIVKYYGESNAQSIGVPLGTVTTRDRFALAVPTLIQTGYGEREGQAPRVMNLDRPIGTVVAGGAKHALSVAFLAKHYGGFGETAGARLDRPLATITTIDHHALVTARVEHRGGNHAAEVRNLLRRFSGDARPQGDLFGARSADDGLVRIHGETYEIADIGMRMLVPRELFRGQGFPDDYIIDPEIDGKPLSKTAQIRMCGNSVSPCVARALALANTQAEECAA